jgi:acetyl-CoA C-acetyltransferase
MARATLMARKCNDCFSISEIVQYEILGFAERGEGAQLIESGATSLPSGRLPVKAGGGLIGDGHPVGATGVRQVAEAFTQLTGKAGARQIDGTERFLSCNTGGSVRTSVVVVWEAF